MPPASFQSLYGETPSAVASTLSQLASQTAAGAVQSVTRTMNGFLTSVFDFGGAGRPADAPLVSAIAEIRIALNVIFSTQFDGEFTRGAGSGAGSGRPRCVW
jgi:hypothetical protein